MLKVLDLFSGEGGAAAGYQRAGFEVYAVDIDAKAISYNPSDKTLVADWLDGLGTFVGEVDLIHASPPCQSYTNAHYAGKNTSRSPQLIEQVRDALETVGKPYIIENVPGSDNLAEWGDGALRPTLYLTGHMFNLHATLTPTQNRAYKARGKSKCRAVWGCGDWPDSITLGLYRKRLFEANFVVPQLNPVRASSYPSLTVINGSDTANFHRLGHRDPTADECRQVMGITHLMSKHGVAESIPPAYTCYIGESVKGLL